MYKIYECKDYLLVINTYGKASNHSHFSTRDKNKTKVWETCKTLIKLMEHKRIPKSNYLLQSALRLTTDKSYKDRLLEEKERRIKESVLIE